MTPDDKLYLLHRKLLDMKTEYNLLLRAATSFRHGENMRTFGNVLSDIEEMIGILSTNSSSPEFL